MPVWDERLEWLTAKALPDRVRRELEQFFVSATFFTDKNPKITGWRGAAYAEDFIRAKMRSQP